MIYFTADWHLWHENIIGFCNREFKTCRQMHKRILYEHNNLVQKDDILYIIGDVYWKNSMEELKRILENYNGRKILVLGNHDRMKPFDYIEAGFSQVATSLEVQEFILVHDPCYSVINPHRPHICGHVHTLFKKVGNVLNVGVDVWNYKPVSIDQARELFIEDGK